MIRSIRDFVFFSDSPPGSGWPNTCNGLEVFRILLIELQVTIQQYLREVPVQVPPVLPAQRILVTRLQVFANTYNKITSINAIDEWSPAPKYDDTCSLWFQQTCNPDKGVPPCKYL